MTVAEIGSALLMAAIGVALAGLVTGRRGTLRLAALLSALSTLALAYALVSSDFSLDYVVRTTSLATPWPYRMAALWGGMEGSILFYSAMTLAVASFASLGRAGVRAAAAVGLALLGITAVFANPFTTLDVPAVDGMGLLAILQHPAMIYHPPILYLGLTSLIVAFAKTMDKSFGDLELSSWLVETRAWLYFSWTILTVGMVAGASWAYVELGWGGYWAWDPVENTSLMPWLAATVFLHSSRVEEATNSLVRTNTYLAGIPFALTVVGVYLTRSGITGSIHSFAEDPSVGLVLFVSTLLVLGVLSIATLREPRGAPVAWKGRRGWLNVSAILVSAALAFVTAGSLYPAFRSVFFAETLIVDARFFVLTILPIAVLIAVFLSLAVSRRWALFSWSGAIGAALTAWVYGPGIGLLLTAPAVGSIAVLVADLVGRRPRRRQLSLRMAHLGMAILLFGVAGSSFGEDFEGPMQVGDSVEVSGITITLNEVSSGEEDRYLYVRADFDVDGRGLAPEIRAFEDQSLPVAEPALLSGPSRDVIVATSLLFPDGETVDVSIFVRPLVWWVWAGALLISVAGLTYLLGKGGVDAERRRLARAKPPAAGTTNGTDVR